MILRQDSECKTFEFFTKWNWKRRKVYFDQKEECIDDTDIPTVSDKILLIEMVG